MATTPSKTASLPLQQIVLRKEDLDDPSLALLNQTLTGYTQMINYLLGHAGEITLNSDLNLAGKRLRSVGDPVEVKDAVSHGFAQTQYGPEALRPHFEALGKAVFKSYRRLSDVNQREKYSSFLNAVLNTAPTSNTATVSFGAPGGGTVGVTVSSGQHQRVDGSVVPFASRNDTLSLPTSWNITSLVRSGGVVTATTSATNTLVAGQNFTVVGASDPSFNGTFRVEQILSGTQFTYIQIGPDGSSGAVGKISLGGVYYYTLTYGQNVLGLVGPFTDDSWTNRINASQDGTTVIAVAVINSGGGDAINSAAGGTAPSQNAAVAVIRRI